MPNIGLQEEAMAGASGMIFTAADRELIKERTGEVARNRSFREIFAEDNLTHKVENEQTAVKPEQDLKALEERRLDHRHMLQHATVLEHKERFTKSTEDLLKTATAPTVTYSHDEKASPIIADKEKTVINPATANLVKELNINPDEIHGKFALDENDLHSLICKIKELHLKRLLSSNQEEFVRFSKTIKEETLASAKKEAHDWLTEQLENLTKEAAHYKLKLLQSLQDIEFDHQRESAIKWLKELTN